MPHNPLTFRPDTLYFGDCLQVMQGWPDACVDLIYLDPPFNSNANYNIIYGKDREGVPRDEWAQFTAFEDTWYWSPEAAQRADEIKTAVAHPAHKAIRGLAEILPETGMLAYLVYMADRLAEMPRILKDTGSIYLHCDPTASHYLKAVMDNIFGVKNFRNEIVWRIGWVSGYKTQKIGWIRNHEIILYYAKNRADFTFNKEFIPYKEGYLRRDGKPPTGKGIPIEDTWNCSENDVLDSIMIKSFSKEKLGYPTQKPLALLERIVKASSNEGDVVLDPFCGCGTTAEAAFKHGRKLIGIDISPFAITRICRDRLKNTEGLSIRGLPTDLNSAREMASDDPFAFERWAVTTLPGFMPNDKQTGDGGIDGRGFMLNPPQDEDGNREDGRCVVQVKGGNFSPDSIRAMLSKIRGGAASMGVFVTMEKCETPTARECTAKAGSYKEGAKSFNRMQFWSMEEYFSGARPPLPAMKDPGTGHELQEPIPPD